MPHLQIHGYLTAHTALHFSFHIVLLPVGNSFQALLLASFESEPSP